MQDSIELEMQEQITDGLNLDILDIMGDYKVRTRTVKANQSRITVYETLVYSELNDVTSFTKPIRIFSRKTSYGIEAALETHDEETRELNQLLKAA
jgi:hypothetical protein